MAQFDSEVTAGKQGPVKDIELKLQQVERITGELRKSSKALAEKLDPILSSPPNEKEPSAPAPECLTPLSQRLQEITNILEAIKEQIADSYNRLEI